MTQASKSEAENERAAATALGIAVTALSEIVEMTNRRQLPLTHQINDKAFEALSEVAVALARGDHLPSLAEQEKDV